MFIQKDADETQTISENMNQEPLDVSRESRIASDIEGLIQHHNPDIKDLLGSDLWNMEYPMPPPSVEGEGDWHVVQMQRQYGMLDYIPVLNEMTIPENKSYDVMLEDSQGNREVAHTTDEGKTWTVDNTWNLQIPPQAASSMAGFYAFTAAGDEIDMGPTDVGAPDYSSVPGRDIPEDWGPSPEMSTDLTDPSSFDNMPQYTFSKVSGKFLRLVNVDWEDMGSAGEVSPMEQPIDAARLDQYGPFSTKDGLWFKSVTTGKFRGSAAYK